MSHFISGAEIEAQLVLNACPHRVSRLKIRKYLRSHTLEDILGKTVPEKYKESLRSRPEDQDQARAEQDLFVNHKCSEIRRELRSILEPNSRGKYPQAECSSSAGGSPPRKRPTTFEQLRMKMMNLGGKQGTTSKQFGMEQSHLHQNTLKLGSISEAKQISRDKAIYRKWLNQDNTRHHPYNPNLTKMAYLFQKIMKADNRHIRTEPNEDEPPVPEERLKWFASSLHSKTQEASIIHPVLNGKRQFVRHKRPRRYLPFRHSPNSSPSGVHCK